MAIGPQRIVCLTEEPTEVLYALGEQDRIVGISGFTVRPAIARKIEQSDSFPGTTLAPRTVPKAVGMSSFL